MKKLPIFETTTSEELDARTAAYHAMFEWLSIVNGGRDGVDDMVADAMRQATGYTDAAPIVPQDKP